MRAVRETGRGPASAPWLERLALRYFARLILIASVALLSAGALAVDRQPPRIAHYVSEFARVAFVLDLSGELPKIRFDRNEEILVLRFQPAAGGSLMISGAVAASL